MIKNWPFIFLIGGSFFLVSAITSTTGNIFIDPDFDEVNNHVFTEGKIGINTTSPSSNLHLSGGNLYVSGRVGVSTLTPMSNLEINGSLGFGHMGTSSDLTAGDNTIIVADTSLGSLNLTLPFAGNVTGRIYKIKKNSQSNTLTVRTENGGNIDNRNPVILTSSGNSYPFLEVYSNGTQWYITSANNH